MIQSQEVYLRYVVDRTTYRPVVLGGRITVDEGSSPYVSATFTLPLPTDDLLAHLDPAGGYLFEFEQRRRTPPTPGYTYKTFSRLVVTSRTIDYREGTVIITLGGLETLFNDFAPVLPVELGSYQASAREVVNRALSAAGQGGLVGGNFVDRPLRTFFELRNLLPQSSFERNLHEDWTSPAADLSTFGAYAKVGGNSLRIRPNTVPGVFVDAYDSYAQFPVSVSAGRTYRAAGYISVPVALQNARGRERQIVVAAKIDDVERVIASSSKPTSATTTAPVRLNVLFTVPAGASDVVIRFTNGAPKGGGDVFWDALTLFEGDGTDFAVGYDPYDRRKANLVDHFDGNTPDTDEYAYAWDDGIETSTPRRVPRTPRPPEVLRWMPGVSGFNFLTPILELLGARLIRGIDGFWYLNDKEYRELGTVTFRYGDNLYEMGDTLTIDATHPDGSPLWADAVAILYRWIDDDGQQQEQLDTAAPLRYRRLYYLEMDHTAYPGPGRAAYLLGRFRARAQQRTLTARMDWDVTPSQQVAMSARDGDLLTGLIDSVTWDLDRDEMTVTTKGLVVTPSTAWNQLPETQQWADEPTDAPWAQDII